MIKLKTLKDLLKELEKTCPKEPKEYNEVAIRTMREMVYPNLKQEAIKWVKDGQHEFPVKLTKGMAIDYTTDNTRRWIIHFFNISKEDLK